MDERFPTLYRPITTDVSYALSLETPLQRSLNFPYVSIFVDQKHTPTILELDSHQLRETKSDNDIILGEGDGIYFGNCEKRERDYLTSLPLAIALCIKTADCLPIFVLGKGGEYAALHAGWRGLHNSILKSLQQLPFEPTYFFIGPAIQTCCYNVGEEFTTYFSRNLIRRGEESKTTNHHLFFDLQGEAISQIKELFSSKTINIESMNFCTCCSNGSSLKLCSYRRDQNSDRNYNYLLINKKL